MGELYAGSETIGRDDPRFKLLVHVCLEGLDGGSNVKNITEGTKEMAKGLYPSHGRIADSIVTAAITAAREVQSATSPLTPEGIE